MLGDQDSLTPFAHCLCQGGTDGFVELAFDAGPVGCRDGHREVSSCIHVDLTFLCVDSNWAFTGAPDRQLTVCQPI